MKRFSNVRKCILEFDTTTVCSLCYIYGCYKTLLKHYNNIPTTIPAAEKVIETAQQELKILENKVNEKLNNLKM